MEVLQRTANRGSISTGAASYEIDNSLKFEADNSEFLTQTIGTGNRRTATYSFWLKRTELDASSYMQVAGISPISSETVRFMFYQDYIMLENGSGGTRKRLTTNAVYRDTSAFYHFVVAIDTTQSTAANRVKLYVNGVQETSFSTEEYPDQNFDLTIGLSGNTWRYGAYDASNYKFSGYLTECNYIDGAQLAPTEFGEFDADSGIWKPIAYAGAYGAQGHYLDFKDSADLGANAKGSDVNFTLNNITAADQATDTPTNNFATLEVGSNPAATFITFNEGNTKLTYAGSTTGYDADGSGISNFRVNTSGKWYMEFSFAGDGDRAAVGVVSDQGANRAAGADYTNYIMYRASDGAVIYDTNGPDVIVTAAGPTYDTPDVIGIALDCDNERVSFSKNGSWIDGSGAGASNSSPTYFVDWTGHYFLTNSYGNGNCVFYCSNTVNSGTPVIEANFGGYTPNTISSAATDANGYGTFEYAPPSGYYALCTKNLAEYG
jgi:hypothetical protein